MVSPHMLPRADIGSSSECLAQETPAVFVHARRFSSTRARIVATSSSVIARVRTSSSPQVDGCKRAFASAASSGSPGSATAGRGGSSLGTIGVVGSDPRGGGDAHDETAQTIRAAAGTKSFHRAVQTRSARKSSSASRNSAKNAGFSARECRVRLYGVGLQSNQKQDRCDLDHDPRRQARLLVSHGALGRRGLGHQREERRRRRLDSLLLHAGRQEAA